MSRKHKKGIPGTAVLETAAHPRRGGEVPDPIFAAEAAVRGLIAGKHSKAALDAAKNLHKRHATPASESLLLEAYQARMGDLLRHGMLVEARSLMDLVIGRFPSATGQLEDLLLEMRLNEGNLDDVVARLADADLPPPAREKIERAIRQQVADLAALGCASSLPLGHSLRKAAAALAAAFEAATRGPVGPSDLVLLEVSRGSPLASWKALVNAIAAFHRRADADCRRWLHAIAPDSVPARLVPVIQTMLGAASEGALSSSAQKLVAATGSGGDALRPALAILESALAAKKPKLIIEKGRAALSVCRQFHPALYEKLQRHLSMRTTALGFSPDWVQDAIGGKIKEDAQYFHLIAKAAEGRFQTLMEALLAWATFRDCALREGWFVANSMEDGVLLLHLAELAADVAEGEAEDMLGPEPPPDSFAPGVLTPWQVFSPDALYERACRADPHAEAFQSWLAWAKKQGDWRVADRAAECWHEAREKDVAPLLWLMESSEKRNAYQKSLRYLARTEQLDHLNPEVRKAKIRLLVAGALRHFRQRKPHLASEGIEQLEALAEPGGNLPALVSVLRRVCAALNRDPEEVERYGAEAEARLGSPVTAYVLLHAVADSSVLAPEEILLDPPRQNALKDPTLLKEVARACMLGESVGIQVTIPEKWEDRLRASVLRPDQPLDIAETLVVGEAAIRSAEPKLAFAASVAGLTRGGADSRFLFLRARALPPWAPERRYDCLAAALELARRERNPDLVGKLLEQLRHRARNMFEDEPGPKGYAMEPEFLNEVLKSERQENKYPLPERESFRYTYPDAFDDADEDESEEDELEALEEFLGSLPPEVLPELTKAMAQGRNPEEILRMMLFGQGPEAWSGFLPSKLAREIQAVLARGVSAEEIMEEIMAEMGGADAGDEPETGDSRRSAPKRKKSAALPEQGSLF
jgi:hypothetical protein